MKRKRQGKLTTRKVMKAVKRLRNDLRPAIDYVDTQEDATNITQAGFLNLISNVDMRSDTEEGQRSFRDVDTIQAKNLLIRGAIKWNTNQPNVAIRMLVLMKKIDNDVSYNTTTTTTGGVLQNLSSDTLDVLAPLAWLERRSFKVLSDDLMIGNPDSVDNLVFKKYFKFNHQIRYSGDTAVGSDCRGNIYLLCISDRLTDNYPTITYHARFKYSQNS